MDDIDWLFRRRRTRPGLSRALRHRILRL